MYAHVFFDFFGTLVDYEKGHCGKHHQGSYRVLAENGLELTYEDYLREWEATFELFERNANATLDEFSMDALCKHFLKDRLPEPPNLELLWGFRDAYLDEWSDGVSGIPGVDKMLGELASRCHLTVVSNTHHEPLVTGLLERFGMSDHVSVVVTSEAYGRRKPCASIYGHALEEAGAKAATTAFVGDSFVHDYAGAQAAGLRALLIDPDEKEQIPDEHRLHHILELPDRISPLG